MNEKKSQQIRTILFASGEFALPTLTTLQKSPFKLTGIVTQPDRPSGRDQKLTPTPVNEAAPSSLPLFQPKQVAEILEKLAELSPDLIVVVDYGQIITPEILNVAPAVNLHPSLLPKYRGPSPIQTAIINGDPQTGVTLMELDEALDHGPIIAQKKQPIAKSDSYESLHKSLAETAADLLKQSLPDYLKGALKPQPQDDSQATYSEKLAKESGHLARADSANQMQNMIRALNAWPGTYFRWKDRTIKVLDASVSKVKLPLGKVKLDNSTLLIGAGSGSIEVTRLQLDSKPPTNAKSFLNGYPQIDGVTLS